MNSTRCSSGEICIEKGYDSRIRCDIVVGRSGGNFMRVCVSLLIIDKLGDFVMISYEISQRVSFFERKSDTYQLFTTYILVSPQTKLSDDLKNIAHFF